MSATVDPLGDARAALVAALKEAGLRVADHGAAFTPPGVIVLAADPWLVPGETFGTWRARFDVHVVTGTVLTRPAILKLEQLVGKAAGVLAGAVAQFGPPTAETFGDSIYLSSTATALIDL